MKVEDRFFPRVWDGERYYYPCFSELGVTYESDDLPSSEENIKNLNWAFGWHIPLNGDDLDFDHILEDCTGLRDKNGTLIYLNDIVELTRSRNYGWLKRGKRLQVKWNTYNCCGFGFGGLGNLTKKCAQNCVVVGSVTKNPELLNGVK